jgi:hypothetical protein
MREKMKCLKAFVILVFWLGAASLSAQTAAQGTPPTQHALSPISPVSSDAIKTDRLNFEGKERYFAGQLFSPWNAVTPALSAGIEMARADQKVPPRWREGAGGFGRLYGSGVASLASFDAARFLSGAMLREDPRYFRADSPGTGARLGHALLFTVLDRSDSGRRTLALSNFIGAAAGGTVTNLVLPPPYNQKRYALSRGAVVLAYYAGTNINREFAPELNRLRKKLHLP